jgi:hypothetical protein
MDAFAWIWGIYVFALAAIALVCIAGRLRDTTARS